MIRTAREVAKNYPDIPLWETNIDAQCMWLVRKPLDYDVLVAENMFGDILSDQASGLVGGLGFAPGVNIGKDVAMFEAVHGSAPDIAGRNIANPTALLLAACLMLDHLGLGETASRIRDSVKAVVTAGETVTRDLGGTASTTDFTAAVIEKMQSDVAAV